MENRREAISRVMAELLEIPKDLVLDLPKITVIGRRELYLENHRGIIKYSRTCLHIGLVRGFLEIEGRELEIKALMPDEMSIIGEIYMLKFSD